MIIKIRSHESNEKKMSRSRIRFACTTELDDAFVRFRFFSAKFISHICFGVFITSDGIVISGIYFVQKCQNQLATKFV